MSSQIDPYEKFWLWAAAGMIAVFLGAIAFGASQHAIHPPSAMETIDPLRVRTDSDFANPRVEHQPDGTVTVIAVAEMFSFRPSEIRVPVNTSIRFRMTSPDVLHGFQVVGTNANVMVVPGYVTEFSMTFPKPGEYLVVCNEFCGLAHHLMQARLIVERGES
jgi:cytochrome c oxidase subunit 2